MDNIKRCITRHEVKAFNNLGDSEDNLRTSVLLLEKIFNELEEKLKPEIVKGLENVKYANCITQTPLAVYNYFYTFQEGDVLESIDDIFIDSDGRISAYVTIIRLDPNCNPEINKLWNSYQDVLVTLS